MDKSKPIKITVIERKPTPELQKAIDDFSADVERHVQIVSDIGTYYARLTPQEREDADDYSFLLLERLRGVREEAAIQVHAFAPTIPFSVLLHVVEHGMEDNYDRAFLRHLIVLHRAHWSHLTSFGPPRDNSYEDPEAKFFLCLIHIEFHHHQFHL